MTPVYPFSAQFSLLSRVSNYKPYSSVLKHNSPLVVRHWWMPEMQN